MITSKIITKLLKLIDAGIQDGAGNMTGPGTFCVEQAISEAMDEHDNSDSPDCVHHIVRSLSISFNDSNLWNDNKDRAKGLRRFAVAQLGSTKINGGDFSRIVIAKWFEMTGIRYTSAASIRDFVIYRIDLLQLVHFCTEALVELKSPGAEFLYMCDGEKPKPEHQAVIDRMRVRQLEWHNYAQSHQTSNTSHCA